MTRKEQIQKAAEAIDIKIISNPWTLFEKGAELADAHHHWISVEEELPKGTINNNVTDMVLTFSADGYIRLDRYMHYHHKWVNGASEVTHWMPMPALPILSNVEKIGKDLKGGEE